MPVVVIAMKHLLALLLLASWIGIGSSQVFNLVNDTDISVTVNNGTVGGGTGSIFYKNANFRSSADNWGAGIRPDNVSDFTDTCQSVIGNYQTVYISNSPESFTVEHRCGASALLVRHSYQRSLSPSIIKAVVTLTNDGSTTMPVVQYRRFDDFDCLSSINSMYSVPPVGLSNVIRACNLKFSGANTNVSYTNFSCDSDSVGNQDWGSVYDFQLGPIAPGGSVSFNIFLGGGDNQTDACRKLLTNSAELGSLWKAGNVRACYIAFSGLGGVASAFAPCAMLTPMPSNKPSGIPSRKPSAKPSRKPLTSPRKHGICFSSMNTVDEKSQGIIPITELKIGDHVNMGSGDYTLVYGFGHLDYDREETFLQIQLLDGGATNNSSEDVLTMIEISNKHLIFVSRDGQSYPIRAENVAIGDSLSGKIVVKVNKVVRRGVYAPLTMSGEIAVSDIRASSYVDLLGYTGWYDRHAVGHAAFAPRRLFCHYFMDSCMKETYTDGYGSYTRFILWCASAVNRLGWAASRCAVVFHTPTLTAIPVVCFGVSILCVVLKNVIRRTK